MERWPPAAQYFALLSMASTLDDLAGIWESIMENPILTAADRDALEQFTNRKEREIGVGILDT